jgi:outer membrane biosynthesis protein TonB
MRGAWGSGWRAWALVVLVAGTTAACARPRPLVIPDPGPELGVPAVPDRVLAAVPEPEEVEAPPATPPEPDAAPVRRPRPRPARTEPAAKPDTPPETTPPAVEPPVSPPGPELRTVETRDDAEATRRVREILGRATAALGRVSARSLGREARSQYDMAHRFIAQADEALKVRNFMLAAYLAGKAETIARELAR